MDSDVTPPNGTAIIDENKDPYATYGIHVYNTGTLAINVTVIIESEWASDPANGSYTSYIQRDDALSSALFVFPPLDAANNSIGITKVTIYIEQEPTVEDVHVVHTKVIVIPNATGNGNNGTLVGNPKSVEGKFGSALEFDGTNGVEIDNPQNFEFLTWTYVLWFRAEAGGDYPNLIGRQFDNAHGWTIHLDPGGVPLE